MGEIKRSEIESLVRQIILEQMKGESASRTIDQSGVMAIDLPLFEVRDADRLDTGNPNDRVWTRDLMTLEESPRLGCGLMVMEDTTFNWQLGYDEIDYIIDGELSVIVAGRKVTAGPGQLMYIPKDSDIQFSVTGKARFIYITYPADWQN